MIIRSKKANITKGKSPPILDHAIFEGVLDVLQGQITATQI
jgi:hypothetical protein